MVDIPGDITTTTVLNFEPGTSTASFSGDFEALGDKDWLKFTPAVTGNHDFFLSLQDVGFQNGLARLRILDADGITELADAVPGTGAGLLNASASVSLTAGTTYYVEISNALSSRGEYSLLATTFFAVNTFLDDNDNNNGGGANQRVVAGPGDDTVNVGVGGFDALGEQGEDILVGNDFANLLSGGLGNDQLNGSGGSDYLFGDRGNDQLVGETGDDRMFGGDGNDNLIGDADNDALFGGDGNDLVIGGAGTDSLSGGTGDDTLFGDDGIDTLVGGLGKDLLTGGAERDIFDFNSTKESVKGGNRDQILDFTRGNNVTGDDIDLGTIDAKTGVKGNNAFKFIGKQDFHDEKGELRYEDKGSKVIVQGDVNGDGKADFEIYVAIGALAKGDFLL